jgi:hypothetical protein
MSFLHPSHPILELLLLLAAPLSAPKVDLPAELKPVNSYAVWSPAKDSGVVNAEYVPLGHTEAPFPTAQIGGDPRAFFLPTRGLAPATYEYLAIFTGDKGELVTMRFKVPVGLNPNPPTPVPPDPPGPVTPAQLYVVVIEETDQAARGRGAMFTSGALKARFAEKGHKWRVVDQNVVGPDNVTPPADVVQFLEAAKGKPYPMVFLVVIENGKRVIRYSGPCPPKDTDLLALIQKWGG